MTTKINDLSHLPLNFLIDERLGLKLQNKRTARVAFTLRLNLVYQSTTANQGPSLSLCKSMLISFFIFKERTCSER